jgi:hypothetical protein
MDKSALRPLKQHRMSLNQLATLRLTVSPSNTLLSLDGTILS